MGVVTFCLCFLLCVMVILNLGASVAIAQGIDVPKAQYDVYLYDDEHLLTDKQSIIRKWKRQSLL